MHTRSQKQKVENQKQATPKKASIQFKDQRPENERITQLKQVAQRKPNNTGLPDNLKSGMENLSGYSMDDVKVHYNSAKPAQLQAHAYAQGNQIHLGPGQEKHLPHEAWHVVQQKQGRVKPTMQLKGKVNINDDAGLEKEADFMGAKALQMKNDNIGTSKKGSIGTCLPVAQLMTLKQATLDTGFKEVKTNTNLFDTLRMKKGWQYNLDTNSKKNDYQSVIGEYTSKISPLGGRLASRIYTDVNLGKKVKQVSTKASKVSVVDRVALKDDLVAKKLIQNDTYFDDYDKLAEVNNELAKKGDRDAIRDIAQVETIDPFVTIMKVTPTQGVSPQPWEIHTQFADSATGYITKIKKGDSDTTGSIKTRDDFNKDKNTTTIDGDDFTYSSTHDQSEGTFGSKIESISDHEIGDKEGKHHQGFDAITWMAAEGARYDPVKKLGGKASPQSLFFIIPDQANWKKVKGVDLNWLMGNWKDEFSKAYNISASTIKTKVSGMGLQNFPSSGYLFNLETGKIIDAKLYLTLRNRYDWKKLKQEKMISDEEGELIAKQHEEYLLEREEGFSLSTGQSGSYEHTNNLIGRKGTSTSRAPLSQQDAIN